MSQQRFIALHAIQLIVAGELTTVKPSFPLLLEDQKQIDKLVAAKAIRVPEENELRLFKEDTTSASSDQSKKPDAGTITGDKLAKLKKEELIRLAADENIEVDPTASNANLVKAIEDGRKAKADADTDPEAGLV